MRVFRWLSQIIFLVYLALLPGSIVVVALDRVPAWGGWMGGALLIIQGAAVLCWLIGWHGRRGVLAALPVFLLAWGVEHLGVTTGFPFGRYEYTAMLWPQFFGVVPLPITCAWLMVAFGVWQLVCAAEPAQPARLRTPALPGRRHWPALAAATLVLLLDLQIETIATLVNRYWVWHDRGPYYGVPTANFIAWWLVGLGMALLVAWILPGHRQPVTTGLVRRRVWQAESIPAYLYLLSTLMFTVVNLARGHTLAGLVGLGTLLAISLVGLLVRGYVLVRPQPDRRARGD